MAEITVSDVQQNFGRVWPGHVAAFARYLIACRNHFRGDLDLLLLLAVIGDRTLVASKVRDTLTYSEFLDGTYVNFPPDAINYQSIADYVGMPRETVRRKVNELIEIGWVRRTENGLLVATQKASEDLAPLTEEGISYLVQMSKVLDLARTSDK